MTSKQPHQQRSFRSGAALFFWNGNLHKFFIFLPLPSYLTLEEKNGEAIISFKNISREPLNLSTDELLERFVQGDNSRKSEGNGLGLSIAKSLTELQNGTMELTTDGDLFKVVLRFPTIS